VYSLGIHQKIDELVSAQIVSACRDVNRPEQVGLVRAGGRGSEFQTIATARFR
jgi:hypothetical protein